MTSTSGRTTPGTPLVSVIIVAWNSGRHLQHALDALARQTLTDFDILVWDNASTDGSIAGLSLPPNARVHVSEANLGFAGGNNRAVEHVSGRFIALLNPDAFPAPDWLAQLVAMQARTGAAAVGSIQLRHGETAILDGVGDCISPYGIAWRGGDGVARAAADIREGEVFSVCAAAALYTREDFLSVGGFDERYFCYFEDVDLGFRLRWRGRPSVIAPDAVVEHVGSATLGRRSETAMYYGTRNRYCTFIKCMPLIVWIFALPAFLAANVMFVLGSKDPGEKRGRWRGFVDGLKRTPAFALDHLRLRAPLLRQFSLLAVMAWNPLRMVKRDVVIIAPQPAE